MILQDLAHRFPPIPELMERGVHKSLRQSEECGAWKHQNQITLASGAAEIGLDCERGGVSSNRKPILYVHRLCGPGARSPSSFLSPVSEVPLSGEK